MTAYYNEIDPFAAQWLRELIKQNLIAPGDVDERSIEDVRPADLKGYKQCHFFAGIGVWSYAARQAGIPDDYPIWTGSCPCQPFSSAGQGKGFDDARHLWPSFYWLIAQCNPPIIFGEQVASKAVNPWIDLVQADLEALGYGVGCIAFPSAGVGAPHIRDRAYWVANTDGLRFERLGGSWQKGTTEYKQTSRMADSANSSRQSSKSWAIKREFSGSVQQSKTEYRPANATNGYWSDVDWLGCRDGKWRPVEPGTFPLVDGATARVGRLRGYGNAINVEQAKIWIETVMQCLSK